MSREFRDSVKPKQSWTGQSTGSALGTRIFIWLLSACGLRPAYVLLWFVSFYYALFNKKACSAIKKLRHQLNLPVSLVAYHRHFFTFGMSMLDRYAFQALKKSPFTFDCINENVIEEALTTGKGVVLLGAHYGNGELAGTMLQGKLPTTINYIKLEAERQAERAIFKNADSNRAVNIIPYVENSPSMMVAIVQALRRGEIVCLHGDRVVGADYRMVSFLGMSARFPRGAFAIAAATGASIVPIFVTKESAWHYRFEAFEPITVAYDRAEREAQIAKGMERYVGLLENVVRKNPYNWFNFYDFWQG